MANKKELAEALNTFQVDEPKQQQPATTNTPAKEAAYNVGGNMLEALKASYGAKWGAAAKRGNPYGRVVEPVGDYTRVSFIMDTKQHKALRNLAAAEGLQLKEALELIVEVGLIAVTGEGSENAEVTEEDNAPKFKRKANGKK